MANDLATLAGNAESVGCGAITAPGWGQRSGQRLQTVDRGPGLGRHRKLLPGASLAATRATVAPLAGPRPASTTKVARFPAMIATLGKPMIAQTLSETLTAFSPGTG